MSKYIHGKMKFALKTPFLLAVFTCFPFTSLYPFRTVVSITTWETAPLFGKRYLIFTVLEHVLMQVYVGDFRGTFINVKTELRRPSNPRSGSLEIPFTMSAVSIAVSKKSLSHGLLMLDYIVSSC